MRLKITSKTSLPPPPPIKVLDPESPWGLPGESFHACPCSSQPDMEQPLWPQTRMFPEAILDLWGLLVDSDHVLAVFVLYPFL